MAGRVIRLVPKSLYEFNSLGAGGQTTVALAQRIDVSQYTDLTLMVRAHSVNIPSGSGTLTVRAVADGHTDEDPAQFFIEGTSLGDVAIDANTSQPEYNTVALSAGSGAMIAVLLIAAQDASQPVDLEATISVDLSMKD